MKNLYSVIVKCRKCETQRQIMIPDTFSVEDTMKKLSHLKRTDCPTCGEEPYDNWYFVGIRKTGGKNV